MAKIDINTLKTRFEDGDIPTGADFANLIDTLTDYNDLQVHAALTTTAHGGIVTSASTNLTGIPTAPTAAEGTNTDQIATTRFVNEAVANAALGDVLNINGTIDTAYLGTGTANSSTYLRGDGTWSTIDGINSDFIYETKTSNFTAVDKHYYVVDTSSNTIIVTLPPNPIVGTAVVFVKSSVDNIVSVLKNGNLIEGIDDNLTVDSNDIACLTFIGGGIGWKISTDSVNTITVSNTSGTDINAPSTIQSTNFVAIENSRYVVNGLTEITLPSTPTINSTVEFIFIFDPTSVVINRNGNNIMGLSENLVLDQQTRYLKLCYCGSSFGWCVLI